MTGQDLPAPPAASPRLTTAEVCAQARLSRATLWRRIACGRLPRPVDYGRQALFCRSAVLEALARPLPARAPDDHIHAERYARLTANRQQKALTLKSVQNKTAPLSEISSEKRKTAAGLGPDRRTT